MKCPICGTEVTGKIYCSEKHRRQFNKRLESASNRKSISNRKQVYAVYYPGDDVPDMYTKEEIKKYKHLFPNSARIVLVSEKKKPGEDDG